jgi:hypothetical protein
MTEDEFEASYPLLHNPLNIYAAWSFGTGSGCLFETYGKELEFVRSQDRATVWTLIDGADGNQYINNGHHPVNRIGYFISTVPVPEGTCIEVRIPFGKRE